MKWNEFIDPLIREITLTEINVIYFLKKLAK